MNIMRVWQVFGAMLNLPDYLGTVSRSKGTLYVALPMGMVLWGGNIHSRWYTNTRGRLPWSPKLHTPYMKHIFATLPCANLDVRTR